jgi:glycosyltransferase involved in cell wall biosynthesis
MGHRILYVNNSCRVYGAENSLLQLVGGLDRRRFEPLVVLPGAGPLDDALARAGVPVLHAPMVRPRRSLDPLVLGRLGAATLASAWAIARHARRSGAALVHANTVSAMPAAGLGAALAGLPCVWHLRSLRYVPALIPLYAGMSHAVIAVSHDVLRAGRLRPGSHTEVHVVHNGIDADAFARMAHPGRLRAELRLAPGRPLLALVAQMVPWKGHVRFLHALAQLRREWPDAVAAVAGDASLARSPVCEAELHALADSLGLSEAVRFLGFRSDAADVMADADVLVVPSDAEPFGRVALEAMAVGTPVVATGFGGLSEVVQDGVTGLLTHDLAPEALADAAGRLLADAQARAAMGRAGARRVREVFGLARHVQGICAVYRRLLAGR